MDLKLYSNDFHRLGLPCELDGNLTDWDCLANIKGSIAKMVIKVGVNSKFLLVRGVSETIALSTVYMYAKLHSFKGNSSFKIFVFVMIVD